MSIGVGTPARILDLLNAGMWELILFGDPNLFPEGALRSTYLERIIIDISHIDQKRRGILDMKETQKPLMSLLTWPEVKARYDVETRRIEVLFY